MLGTRTLRRTTIVIAGTIALAVASIAPAMASDSYEIAPGDTLFSIAQRHGLSVERVAQMNGIQNPNLIFAGQRISLGATATQGEATTEQPSQVSDSYSVQAGDTLWSIASRFGITVAQLVEANRALVPDQNLIYPGQQLAIPGGAGGAGNHVEPQAEDPAPAPAPAAPSGDVESMLTETANAYGLDPALIKAIAWQESGWNQGVVSSAGALGVMQVMPATGGWISQYLVGRDLDVAGSTSDNILAGVVYLEWLIRYTGNEDQAIASYYQGPGAVSQYGWYDDTHHYVAQVKAIRSHIQLHGGPPR
jgi:N-acetylmuramoyl-L-alanine amidase